MTDLKTGRERGDFIKIYKIVHGLAKENWCYEYKILKPEHNITSRKKLFQLSREETQVNEQRMHFLLNTMSTHVKIWLKTLRLHTRLTHSISILLRFRCNRSLQSILTTTSTAKRPKFQYILIYFKKFYFENKTYWLTEIE